MVESLPILGSVNPGNDLIDVINDGEAGYAFINGEDDALAGAARLLFESSDLRETIGSKSNQLLHRFFSVESSADKILNSLSSNKQECLN